MTIEYWSRQLIYSVQLGNIKSLKEAVKNGANINTRDREGARPITIAAYNGYTECLALLIASNADIHAESAFRKNALSYAVDYNNIDCIKLLISAGSKTNGLNIEQQEFYNGVVKQMQNDNPSIKYKYNKIMEEMCQELTDIALKKKYESSPNLRLQKYLKNRPTATLRRRPRLYSHF